MKFEILIAEDDDGLCMVYENMLQGSDVLITCAADGATALGYLQTHMPAIVILDMLLPIISGEHLLHYIHTAPHLVDTIVLIVTAHENYRNISLRSRDLFFLKPIMLQGLRRTIQDILARAVSG